MWRSRNEKNSDTDCEPEIEVYTRRWFILVASCLVAALTMFGSKSFTVANEIYAAYFNVSLTVLDWSCLGLNAGAILVTPYFSWLFFRKSLGFKMLSIIGTGSLLISYIVIVLSVLYPGLFVLMTFSNFLQGVAYTASFTVGTSFAVGWFPDHQVGLAIACNIVSFSLGTLSGAMIPPALFVNVENLTNTSNFSSHEVLALKYVAREDLLLMYAPILGILLLLLLFFIIFVTDLPPKPPTFALLMKQTMDDEDSRSFSDFFKTLKQLFSDTNFLMCSLVLGIVFNVVNVEIVHITDIVAELNKRVHINLPNNVTGGIIITGFAVACCFASIASARILNKFKFFLFQIQLGGVFSFLSCVAMTFCLYTRFFVGFCLCIVVYAIATRISLIPLLETITRHTYPLDETLVSVWVSFIGCVAQVAFVEIARHLSSVSSPLSLMIFMCICLFISLILIAFIHPTDKRGEILNDKKCPDESSKLLLQSARKYTD